MVILLMILSQLFLFLWFANDIKVESSAIPNIIYTDTNWLSYNVRTRKILIMMMTRSQKPMTCYSAAIGEMTIETFKNMLKLCYSITTFFKVTYVNIGHSQRNDF
ncbi:hypothetical protein JTB14_037160 [Gonioctena quinquepunctata]|nr:hypothetical protein JTB14_037160 [Gonioctena quinquepunctata]